MKEEEYFELDNHYFIESIQKLYQKNPSQASLLVSSEIGQKKIIQSSSLEDFAYFLKNSPDELIYRALTKKGTLYLAFDSQFQAKGNLILNSKKTVVTKLLSDVDFCVMILSHVNLFLDSFYALSYPSSYYLLTCAIHLSFDEEIIEKILDHFSKEVEIDLLNRVKELPKTIFYNRTLMRRNRLQEDFFSSLKNVSLADLSYPELYYLFSKEEPISPILLEDKSFLKKMSRMENVKDYRFLIMKLERKNDVSIIEKMRKEYYDSFLEQIPKNGMLPRFQKWYYLLLKGFQKNTPFASIPFPEKDFLHVFGSVFYIQDLYRIFNQVSNLYQEAIQKQGSILKIKEYLLLESSMALSDMILDYHFEDISYNVLSDMRLLLSFYQEDSSILTNQDLATYHHIIELDNLSYVEKRKVHQMLKETSWVPKFYQDIRKAKNHSYQMIQDSILTLEKLKPYFNEKYQKKWGVDVYELQNEEFYALVKVLPVEVKRPLQKEDFVYPVDAASYSLDSSYKLSTFYSPCNRYNILYEKFDIDQVLHTYPVDSCSKYIRGLTSLPTPRKNLLLTPKQFVLESKCCNELVLLQKNELHLVDEVSSEIQNPVPVALYCYDEITTNDLISAKNLGLSIVLVHRKNYPNCSERISRFDRLSIFSSTNYQDGFDYLRYLSEDSSIGRIYR